MPALRMKPPDSFAFSGVEERTRADTLMKVGWLGERAVLDGHRLDRQFELYPIAEPIALPAIPTTTALNDVPGGSEV